MHNELFKIGSVTVYGYGLMIAIGILAAYLVAEYRAKKKGLDSEPVFSIMICAVICGFAGAKLLYYITVLDEILKDPHLLVTDLADGFVVYGGIIAGIFSVAIFCKIKKIPFLTYMDLILPSVALAQGFGRIGCFLAGCCYGVETDSAFSVTFHTSAYAPNDVALFPSQLVSSGLNFLNFAVLCLLARKNKTPGQIGALYLIFYSIGRFCIEFFRGDLLRGSVGVLSTSQFISIFVAIAGVVMYGILSLHKAKDTDTDCSHDDSGK